MKLDVKEIICKVQLMSETLKLTSKKTTTLEETGKNKSNREFPVHIVGMVKLLLSLILIQILVLIDKFNVDYAI
jgi:hypothetical protein